MIASFYIIVIILNIYMALNKKKSYVILVLTFIFIMIFFAANSYNADLTAYLDIFEKGTTLNSDSGIGSGYLFIQEIFKNCGCNFYFFRGFIISLCYILMFNTVKKYCDNWHYILLFYLFYSIFIDIIQFRNFIAMSIFVFSLRYLISGKIKDTLKYCICIFIAASFHMISILYIIFIAVHGLQKITLMKIILWVILSSCVLIGIYSLNSFIIPNMIAEGSLNRLGHYFNTEKSYGFLISWLTQVIALCAVYNARKLLRKRHINLLAGTKKVANINLEIQYDFVNMVFWINIIAVSFFPLYMINNTFNRLIRNMIIANITVIAIAHDATNINYCKNLTNNLCGCVYILSWIVIGLLNGYWSIVFMPSFTNNFLL